MRIYYIENKYWQRRIAVMKKILYYLALVFSFLNITIFVFKFGYNIDADYTRIFKQILFTSVWVFLIETVIPLFDNFKKINIRTKIVNIIFGLFYIFIANSYFTKNDSWSSIFQNEIFQTLIIGVSSLVYIAKGIMKLLGKGTNPSLILSLSFFVVIFFGTLLLMLPRSLVDSIEFIDALFIATSAVCVTGLTPINISKVFTLEGQTIIMILIQVGGLGVMTITSFFGLFFTGQVSLYNKFVVKDILNTDSIVSLMRMLLYVLGFTLLFEVLGAILMWFSVKGTLGMNLFEEFYFCMFHSVSAFCNAGFSTLPENLEAKELISNNSFYLIISLLIVCGGIGFPILTNITYTISYHIRKGIFKLMKRKKHRIYHVASVNSKIVIVVTLILIIGGSVIFGILEWNNVFEEFTISQKITQSIFNVITPRTAGFNSVDIMNLSNATISLLILLMWIGGGAQSTAGGIKVNVIGVAVYTLINTIKGRSRVEVMNREISQTSINRVITTIILSIAILLISIIILLYFEPKADGGRVVFEAVSALTTTGLSLNFTPELKDKSKLVVIFLMFIGRIGFMTFVMGFVAQVRTDRYKYPKENVIIN